MQWVSGSAPGFRIDRARATGYNEGRLAGAGRNPCVWCDYSFICCHETGVHERALEAPPKPFEPEEENEEEEEQP